MTIKVALSQTRHRQAPAGRDVVLEERHALVQIRASLVHVLHATQVAAHVLAILSLGVPVLGRHVEGA